MVGAVGSLEEIVNSAFRKANGDYSIQNSGIGRIIGLVGGGPDFFEGIEFDDDFFTYIRSMIDITRDQEFDTCILPVVSRIVNYVSGERLKSFPENIYDLKRKIGASKSISHFLDEHELLKSIASKISKTQKDHLHESTRTSLDRISSLELDSQEIDAFYIPTLGEYMNNPPHIQVIYRKKTIYSIATKIMEKFGDVMVADEQTLKRVSRNKRDPVSQIEFRNEFLRWIGSALKAGKDLYEFYDSNKPSSMYNKKLLNEEADKMFLSTIVRDSAGGKIVMSQKNFKNLANREKLEGIISPGGGLRIPEITIKDRRNSNNADGSYTFCVSSNDLPFSGEVKILTPEAFYMSEFGYNGEDGEITPHFNYKSNREKRIIEKMNKDPSYNSFCKRIFDLFNLEIQNEQIVFKTPTLYDARGNPIAWQ